MRRVVASDGVELVCREAGRADGRGAILVHGLTGNADLWEATVGALAPRHRVVAMDLRGHGASGRTEAPDDFTLERAATDVVEVADDVGFGTFLLVGHGVGGDIAQLVALSDPERLEALVLIGCGPGPMDPASGWAVTRRQIADVVADRGIEGGWEAYLEAGLLGWDLHEVPDEILDAWRQQFVRTAPSAFVGFARASAEQADRSSELRGLGVPTLVAVGDDDDAFLTHARRLAELIPGADLAEVPGGGHSPQIARAEEFNEQLLGFIKRRLGKG